MGKRPVHKLLVAAAAVGLALLAGPVAADTIMIGATFPMTGPAAIFGAAASEGVRCAIDDFNKAGGITVNGIHYDAKLVQYDDHLNAAEAVAAFHRLVENDKVKYMFTMISASHMAVKDLAEQSDVLVLTTAITRKAIGADTKHVIKIDSTTRDYVPSMVKWMKQNLPGDRVALFYPNDESGWEFANLTSDLFTKAGYTVVSKELVERSQKDFQSVLTKVIATQPDFIDLGPSAPSSAGLIVRQARELGYTKAFTVLGGAGVREIVAAAGAPAAEGTLHMVYADPNNKNYQALAERYRQQVGQPPLELIVTFYDGATALLKAIALSGDPGDPQKTREVFPKIFPMKSLQGEELTFGGKEQFGVDAQIMTTNYIAILKNGQSVIVGVTK
jgi:branched-chain amino acid transport system substrate-binding protein